MGTISIIVGIILFVLLTSIRVWLILKRCTNIKDRLLSFIKFPGKDAKKVEVLVAIAQLTAACWIGIGLILQSDGFQSSIKTASSSRPIEIGLLIAPVIVFLILLGGITRKDS
jgi:hypothetical protein